MLASIGGSNQTTIWHDITDISSYALAATQSLLNYMDTYSIAGFDIDFEFGIVDDHSGKISSSWLQAWCQVIVSLKEVQLQPYLFSSFEIWSCHEALCKNVGL